MIEKAGLKIVGLRLVQLSEAQARGLLRRAQGAPLLRRPGEVHDLGPLRRDGARGRERRRALPRGHGPDRLEEGARRAPSANKFGTNIERNAVHGSDGPDTAKAELAFFFAGLDLA